jgi:hypothetical protein
MGWRLFMSGTSTSPPSRASPLMLEYIVPTNSSRRFIVMFGRLFAMSGRTRNGRERRSITKPSSPAYEALTPRWRFVKTSNLPTYDLYDTETPCTNLHLAC